MESQTGSTTNIASQKMRKSVYFKIVKFIYLTLQIFCGVNFGFFEYKSSYKRYFWKTITIIQSIILSCMCLLTCDNLIHWFMVTAMCFQCSFYILNVLVLLNINHSTWYKLRSDLERIDSNLGVNNVSYNLDKKMLLIIILLVAYRLVINVINCKVSNFCLHPISVNIALSTLMVSVDVVRFSYSFVFYALNCRLRKLALIMKTANSDITPYQLVYKSIVELAEMHKSAYDPVFILGILFKIPACMFTIYVLVQHIVRENNITIAILCETQIFITMKSVALTIAPAICASMLTSQAHRIKIILHDKLMEEEDESKIREIKRFICYVNAREFRFRVYKLFPLDANLLGMVLHFCVTYLIVMIQFTI